MRKGFTLIELLAVIVILAIIMVIAVPQIFNVIEESRYDTFKTNESIAVKSAKLYLATNPNSLPTTIGSKVSISYNTLKSQNYISDIVDPLTKSDCTYSKVYIEKIGDNQYKYTPALICEDYISIGTFDLLNGEGRFQSDTNNDGLANGWSAYIYPGAEGSYTKSLSNNKQTVTRIGGVNTSAYLYMKRTLNNPIPNNKYYAYVEFENLTNIKYKLQLCIDNSNSTDFTNSTIDNDSINLNGNMSLIHSTRADTIRIDLFLRLSTNIAPAGDGSVKWKNAILLNLTEMYGAGNEPSIEVIDNIMNKEKTMH